MLRRPDGPSYDVVIDEVAIRRQAAPREIVRAQLYHVAARVNSDPKTSVRVLPAFSIYTFADPGDPTVVAVDTVTDDLMHTDAENVRRYEELYSQLWEAAMSVSASLRFLIEVANEGQA